MTEGSRKDREAVYTSNSDPALIRLFMEFLLQVCQVDRSRTRLRVAYYPNMEMHIEEVRQFWRQLTGLEEEQVRVNVYRAIHNYRAKSRYGTARVGVNNVKLRALMEFWLNELYDGVWQ